MSDIRCSQVFFYQMMHQIFRGDIDVVMAVEQFACNRDLEVFVALMYDIASANLDGVQSS